MKKAVYNNITYENDTYLVMNKLDTLRHLRGILTEEYGRHQIHDIAFVSTKNNSPLFQLILLFSPI